MSVFAAEFLGTAVLLLLGNGVVANVVLNKTKGNNSGLIVITWGWAIAVFVGVMIAGQFSGAHLNPAVTVGLAAAGKLDWGIVATYIGAQFAGAAVGTTLVWLQYRQHFEATTDPDAKISAFCNSPAIPNLFSNLLSEVSGTAVLILVVLYKVDPQNPSALHALPVGLTVLGIGLSLGGTTGYAINPARDLGPRIMHAILPIPGKRDSNWSYSWIPVVGPILGALLAVLIFRALGSPASPDSSLVLPQ
ncbi:MAG: MIP/aquaporin family protein [Planctomycetaceae bacterium]